ncbi:NOL1/NOP2/sun domain-containing protein [Histoplasma capsulatum var. duboisii H88]|uniref:NOL1/NOP2/sun domain-containing protein n=1 Tax=Ajellomyces capsulatus (strain H88) TaxID=544711 RepID=F0UEX3_AJEC8|nr:NOL1/NOP2/sun domain-containing protein [Histoplasma capsulatum var. duboisii H88]QSS54830.1 NOL1/NOP2/sun domain-containing protein [Histoplasma capsulatum var. duboisii H88]
MSLYIDAASILYSDSGSGGSFKSRVYKSKLRSPARQVYALITETAKWDILLKEVVENANFLPLEPKLTPLLSILLVHDFLLTKKGIVAPSNHPLRLAIERHKSRIKAEFVKSRVHRQCASIEELEALVKRQKNASGREDSILVPPRWARINNVITTLDEQLKTTFSAYKLVHSLSELVATTPNSLYQDPHIPDLVAVSQDAQLTSSAAYKKGMIILQDKASCFPAFLLLGSDAAQWKGDLLDACAAPGNKTTHLASLLCSSSKSHFGDGIHSTQDKFTIFSCDVSPNRSRILQRMVAIAGAETMVSVLPGQDFLALSPDDRRFQDVTGILLDPSCSGTGIVGRDDVPCLSLPSLQDPHDRGMKRKRPALTPVPTLGRPAASEHQNTTNIDPGRLTKLSNLQTRIVEHAFRFPNATRVTYSTCSIHVQENEVVIARVLKSPVAQRRGWRIISRHEQVEGLRKWKYRGITPGESGDGGGEIWDLTETEREGCLRCWPNDKECTGGFFVAGFVRDGGFERNRNAMDTTICPTGGGKEAEGNGNDAQFDEESDWEGFGAE